MPRLEVTQPLSAAPQPVLDQAGTASPIVMSTTAVGIGAANPETALEIAGDVLLEYGGSPKITLYSRGNGTQRYSIRATNDDDQAGGRLLVIRNESRNSDDLVLDNRGDLKLEHSGSPTITLYSRGNGTQRYSIRATNDDDPAGGRLLVIRNESQDEDVLSIDSSGNVRIPGDILFTGADLAECLEVADDPDPGDVMVIGEDGALRRCGEPYDRRVAGVVSGALDRRSGLASLLPMRPASASRSL